MQAETKHTHYNTGQLAKATRRQAHSPERPQEDKTTPHQDRKNQQTESPFTEPGFSSKHRSHLTSQQLARFNKMRNANIRHYNPKFQFRDNIMVSISACHAEDPGSIPGGGSFYHTRVFEPTMLSATKSILTTSGVFLFCCRGLTRSVQ